MPVTPTYPGIYVEEIPSAVHTITGVSTSATAFVDFFPQGPMNTAIAITSIQNFTSIFGGLDTRSESSYGIQQFFLNGGSQAWVVRTADGSPDTAKHVVVGGSPPQGVLLLEAANEGVWGKNLQVGIDLHTAPPNPGDPNPPQLFNLIVRQLGWVNNKLSVVASEVHRNLCMDQSNARYVTSVLPQESSLVQVGLEISTVTPNATYPDPTVDLTAASLVNNPASAGFQTFDGTDLPPYSAAYLLANPGPVGAATNPYTDANDGVAPSSGTVLNALNALDLIAPFHFNILCIPGTVSQTDYPAIVGMAADFCEDRHAFVIVDIPPSVVSVQSTGSADAGMLGWINDPANAAAMAHDNAAIYFPRLTMPDPLMQGRPRNVGVSGTIAGLYAATDTARGVWKAPAGTAVVLQNATPVIQISDSDNGLLNPLGVNALRTFPVYTNVAWGARTTSGADMLASQWKYIPVRRVAHYIELSLIDGTKWVLFEPNDESLWSQIRLNVGSFMQSLFTQGAFEGTDPASAYLVKCDSDTTTQTDINNGVVNIVVGFQPLLPAEFVVLQIQQLAGQLGT